MLREITNIVNDHYGTAAISAENRQQLFSALAFLEHVFDRRLVDHQIRRAHAVHLDAGAIVPLDYAMNFFIIVQHDPHGSLGLHLLLKIKILRIVLVGRRGFTCSIRALGWPFGTSPPLAKIWPSMAWARVVGMVQQWANQ